MQKFDVEVYIDYLDFRLPDKTDAETAKILRSKIKRADKFILLATPNSRTSKWMPWELGLADRKGTSNIAILPLQEKANSWAEREYFQIYGSLEISSKGKWYFVPPENKVKQSLSKWLNILRMDD